MREPITSRSLQGRLTRSQSGWILLVIPNAIQRGFFQALNAPGAELPMYKGRVTAHISVMRPEELESVGNPKINELGKHFSFNLGRLVETNPYGWEENDRVWFFKVNSPDLIALRRSYGLPDKPKKGRKQLDFHFTVAVRKKGVLRSNSVSKEAAVEEYSEQDWAVVPKVATVLAAELQDAASEHAQDQLGKPGGSRFVEGLGSLAQFWDGNIAGIPNKPSALASMLTLGILGSGIGYGAGRFGTSLINSVSGQKFDKHKLGRTLALMGGAAGVVPGALYALANHGAGLNPLFGDILNRRADGPAPPFTGTMYGSVGQRKTASWSSGAAFNPDHFASIVNQDPFVSGALDPREKAMATGLVYGAQNLPGRSTSPLVTPVDIARMAVGMGSGYASGSLVGRTLGALMGLPEPAQQQIIRSGTFAGAIRGIVPRLFQ